MEKNTDRLYQLIITTVISALFAGAVVYGVFQATHTTLNAQTNAASMRNRTSISKQNIESDMNAITDANIKFNGKNPITGNTVIKEFSKNGLNYSVNTDKHTVSVTSMSSDALDTSSDGHKSLTIPKTVTDNQNTTYTVTSIADEAFENKAIYTVSIPNTIVYIGAEAFKNSNLGDLTQNGEFNIDSDTYNNGARTVLINAPVKFVGQDAFANNYLASVTFSNGDNLASFASNATENNVTSYTSSDKINTAPIAQNTQKASLNVKYNTTAAYNALVNNNIASKYKFISGAYDDSFVSITKP